MWHITALCVSDKNITKNSYQERNGDPYENRTRVNGVRGRRPNR